MAVKQVGTLATQTRRLCCLLLTFVLPRAVSRTLFTSNQQAEITFYLFYNPAPLSCLFPEQLHADELQTHTFHTAAAPLCNNLLLQ